MKLALGRRSYVFMAGRDSIAGLRNEGVNMLRSCSYFKSVDLISASLLPIPKKPPTSTCAATRPLASIPPRRILEAESDA